MARATHHDAQQTHKARITILNQTPYAVPHDIAIHAHYRIAPARASLYRPLTRPLTRPIPKLRHAGTSGSRLCLTARYLHLLTEYLLLTPAVNSELERARCSLPRLAAPSLADSYGASPSLPSPPFGNVGWHYTFAALPWLQLGKPRPHHWQSAPMGARAPGRRSGGWWARPREVCG